MWSANQWINQLHRISSWAICLRRETYEAKLVKLEDCDATNTIIVWKQTLFASDNNFQVFEHSLPAISLSRSDHKICDEHSYTLRSQPRTIRISKKNKGDKTLLSARRTGVSYWSYWYSNLASSPYLSKVSFQTERTQPLRFAEG